MRRVATGKPMPQVSQMSTLLTPKSPPLRPTDPRYVAGSATLKDMSKRTAKSSRHSKTGRKVCSYRKPRPKRPQIKETEEKDVSRSTRTTKACTRRSKKKTPYKQTQECIDAPDELAGITNKLTLAQTDKSPEPETDALPHATNAISSQKDYWETDYWETMTQEYSEGREV